MIDLEAIKNFIEMCENLNSEVKGIGCKKADCTNIKSCEECPFSTLKYTSIIKDIDTLKPYVKTLELLESK